MTDSGNSQDNSDEDIYKDFSLFNFEEEVTKFEENKETFKQEALDLSEKLKLLTEENKELKRLNEILKRNVSTLLKTAQAEVKRKDSMIEELRNKVELITFRRNKKETHEQFTSTDDLETYVQVRSGVREYKTDERKSKSYENKIHTGEYKLYEGHDKKRISSREEKSPSCDKDSRANHYKKDIGRFRKRHNSSNRRFERHTKGHAEYDKKWYSTSPNKYQRLSCRKNSREDRNIRREDKQRRNESESSPERQKSKQNDESPHRQRGRQKEESSGRERKIQKKDRFGRQRRDQKGSSPDHKRRDQRDVLSKRQCLEKEENSFAQTREYKESSLDVGSITSIKQQTSFNKRDTDSFKWNKSEESKIPSGGLDKRKSQIDKTNGKNSKEEHCKADKQSNHQGFDTKSPLDALYSEMMNSRLHDQFSTSKSGFTLSELNLDPNITSKEDYAESQDWMLSFKNERSNLSKPLTLYSKRMMQKFAKETKSQKREEQIIVCGNSSNVNENNGETLKVINQEKEPGELTDDENIIESSKEFQELAKVASIANVMENPVKVRKEELYNSGMFEEPNGVKTVKAETFLGSPIVKVKKFLKPDEIISEREDSLTQKEVESREIGDVIEFSPFKNNYKLIEISPIKASEKHILDFYKKRVPSTGQSQKEVEKSIFNLLSSLSGVPIEEEVKGTEKEPEPQIRELKCGKDGENEKTEVDFLKNAKCEGKMCDCKFKKCMVQKSASTNSESLLKGKSIEKPTEKREVNSRNSKSELENTEETEPGETTQFLDFFLLTTTPSKPIIPEPAEKRNKCEKRNISSKKSESGENAKKTDAPNEIKSSTEKESEELTQNISRTSITENLKEEGKKTKEKINQRVSSKDEKNFEKTVQRISSNQERENQIIDEKSQKRKRDNNESEPEESALKRQKTEKHESSQKRTRSKKLSRGGSESSMEPEIQTVEDISTFEFFRPITKGKKGEEESIYGTTDYTMTTKMSLADVILETPNKSKERVKNVVINEQTIYHIIGSRKNPAFSPLVSSKCVEMTPRRMLKNDLMLTDSEDDSINKTNFGIENDQEDDGSDCEISECGSDSGASDFVDML